LVEQRIENPRVAGSIPALGTIFSFMISDGYDEIAVLCEAFTFVLGVGSFIESPRCLRKL
jgi:hypothetical protein